MSRRRVNSLVIVFSATWLCAAGCEYPQSRAKLESTERWNRARAEIKVKLASDQLATGHIDDAATEITSAFRLDPSNPELLMLQARVFLARGDLAAAERLLTNAQAEGERQAEIEYLLGIIQEQRLRWSAALGHYLRASDVDPREVAYLVAIVQVMLQLGQAEDALMLLESYEPQFGWMGAYHATRAECREQLKDWEGAASAWRRVADANDDPGTRERLAMALYRAGDESEAIRQFERLIADTETQPPAPLRLALAQCLLDEGQPTAAQDQIGFVLREDPRNVRALQLVARVFAQQGQFERARQTAERALRFAPDSVSALELAATLAFRTGDHDRALALAERITQVADSPVARQILTRLSAATPAAK